MSSEAPPSNQREFFCGFCHGRILIPRDLPPTTAPCPHCGQTITSPPLEGSALPLPAMGMPMPVAAPQQPVAVSPAPVPAPVPTGPITSAAVIPPVVIEPAVIVAPAQIVAPVQTVATPAPAAAETMPVKSVPLESVTVRPGMKLQSPRDADEPPPVPPRRGFIDSDAVEPALAKKAKRKSSLLIPILVMLALLVAAVAVYILLSRTNFSTPAVQLSPEEQHRQKEEAYLRDGWKDEAVKLLDKFSNAETPEEKAKWVLNPEQELPAMKAFYGSRKVDDADAPAAAYADFPLPQTDRERGMFMLIYEQPPQLNLREPFFPLQTLEVQNGLADPDDGSKEGMLLTATARVSNFASEEIRVQALFKRTPQGLRLDWPTYVQSKYKTFHDFTELPAAGKSAVFRVLIQEDVPDRGRLVPGSRAYKIYDPGNPAYSVRVNVLVDSEMGHSLSEINWIGTQNPRKDWRTATVELDWSKDESPQLQMKRFICWEFLGLGADSGK